MFELQTNINTISITNMSPELITNSHEHKLICLPDSPAPVATEIFVASLTQSII